ncbi:NotI family restriction endonuclease [Mycobacteroides abscessus]|uniref:NotI family restriction endonuclease n=1 Tax=Mycobacteroides abscessus TaxID=36809 RepID=UPI000699200F|nr:NotI family restriction endonuclease [Mycobacteroides abscessus]MBN7453044.1 hypothetical protein [Mycobacteroides abscessus subsp. abscessus]MDO3027098.1 NotI family restriction endonuclease [Mycobacteroides abscessus subsp. abscessus]MDO3061662.1 NotI family restriction endonuclease [Mycobacteroides abscessus subsp. abscessus]MDO3277670.1 NotI family restriction endonuclease [Mycobacteroides abscessus subsp. abscessus]
MVAGTAEALADQKAHRCPLITVATGTSSTCVKPPNSQGVCTVSACSNGPRQDWLVCPYRALDPDLLEDAVRRMFGHDAEAGLTLIPVTLLSGATRKKSFLKRVKSGKPAIVYFQNRLGGEISLSATERSPEMAFDATMVEVLYQDGALTIGRYGIFEIQTMDFHGSYKHAVKDLSDALRLQGDGFPEQVQLHPEWSGNKIEGPNLANVFKRTFYQMMFKFQIGAHEASAGCVLAIPKSVWDSWQRHLGKPDLVLQPDGTYRLAIEADEEKAPAAWIYVFDLDQSDTTSPNDVKLLQVIATDAASLSYYALTVAPEAALAQGGSVDGIATSIRTRLLRYLPELT